MPTGNTPDDPQRLAHLNALFARLNSQDAYIAVNAFAELYEEIESPMFSFICRFVGNRDDARDLSQDVYEIAWKKRHKLPTDWIGMRKYVFTIAANKALVFLRRRHEKPEDPIDIRHVPPIEPSDPFSGELVERALRRLPPRQRQSMLLVKYLGFSRDEVAEILGVTEPTIADHIRKGKKRLKRELTQLGFEWGARHRRPQPGKHSLLELVEKPNILRPQASAHEGGSDGRA